MPETTDSLDLSVLSACLQCAICTGSCPAARVIDGYNPREIILKYLLYGEAEDIAESDLIWCCTTCHTCEERCPHGISVAELLVTIMNHAAERGNLPQAIRQAVSCIAETGRAITPTLRSKRTRSELGLDPIPECDSSEIRELLRACGVQFSGTAK